MQLSNSSSSSTMFVQGASLQQLVSGTTRVTAAAATTIYRAEQNLFTVHSTIAVNLTCVLQDWSRIDGVGGGGTKI